ncbi:MAG: zinc ABC transporter substrate-binding protein [Hyphomicrobiaceae bacterium]|nr:zinc ABC transporter substrate-binding protein [Hyphomicrobiaceae bacterium]
MDWQRLALALLGWLLVDQAASAAPNVVVSVKPIHSLVAAVMGDLGAPVLLVDNNASPHTFSLRPSDAEALQNADLVVYVGPDLEAFLVRPLASLAQNADILELDRAPGLSLLPVNERILAEFGEGDDDHDGAYDMHLWLDPENAGTIAAAVATELEKLDPENVQVYEANLADLRSRLNELTADLKTELLEKGSGRPIVYHDAFHYFERAFGVQSVGAVTLNPEIATSAAHLSELTAIVKANGADCVFVEPQFEPRLAELLAAEGGIATIEADPLGSQFPAGTGQYEQLLRSLADAFVACQHAE